jgi:hypothetical protein
VVGATRQVAVLAVAIAAVLATGAVRGAEALSAAGACRSGVPHGAYELRGKDGRLRAVGAFAMGRKTGTFIFWTEAGARSAVIPYDSDARTGTAALWYTGARRELARKFEAPYDNNVLHGVLRSYYPNGAPRTECRFDRGQLVSVVAWDGSGSALPEVQARQIAARDIESETRVLAQLDATIGANLPRCE